MVPLDRCPTPALLERRRDEAARQYAQRLVELTALQRRPHKDPDRLDAARDRLAASADRLAAADAWLEAARFLHRTCRDELTGVLQRTTGLDQLAHALARAQREHTALAVAFLDVDRLKDVNDRQGHLAGDRVLRLVGEALRRGLREYDVVLRFGGDEFVCALPSTSVAEAAERLAAVSQGLTAREPDASFSVGLVLARDDESLDAVLHRADTALYRQRAARGPRRVELPEPTRQTASST